MHNIVILYLKVLYNKATDTLITTTFFNLKYLFLNLWLKINLNFKFILLYYMRNELLWLDGFLFDFLQKKTIDIWLRRFVIYTGFLFSERFVFDLIVKFYIDYFIWYFHKLTIFEVTNVFEMLNYIFYVLSTMLFILIILLIW